LALIADGINHAITVNPSEVFLIKVTLMRLALK
jgi:hypothetical protein